MMRMLSPLIVYATNRRRSWTMPRTVQRSSPYAAMHGRRWEELFRAPPDVSPQRAKALRAEWEAVIETRFATLRAKKRGEGHDLTQKQAHALAGEWYRWFTGPHEENPGSPDHWEDPRGRPAHKTPRQLQGGPWCAFLDSRHQPAIARDGVYGTELPRTNLRSLRSLARRFNGTFGNRSPEILGCHGR
jgi:hypothetical protein